MSSMDTPRKREQRLRTTAAFAEAGSDLETDRAHGNRLFDGAVWLRSNAALAAHSPELLAALDALARDYHIQYMALTDGEHGSDPGTDAYRSAMRLVRKLAKVR